MLKVRKSWTKHMKLLVQVVFFIVIAVAIVLTIQKDIKAIDLNKTIDLIEDLSWPSLILFIVLGNAIAASATVYDFIISKYYHLKVKKFTIFAVSLFSYTLNNVFGFGGLTGVSVRSVFLKRADTKMDIKDYVVLLFPAFSIGLSVLSLLLPFSYSIISPIVTTYKIFLWVLVVFILYLPLYFFLDTIFYRFKKTHVDTLSAKRMKLKARLLAASAINWIWTLVLFLVILRHFNDHVQLRVVFSVFTFASMGGIISMLPGGVGSFDLIILLGFKNFNVPSEHILATIVLFRIFNYFVPLIFSTAIFLVDSYRIKLQGKE